jgi:hypothetical protein
MGTRIVAGIVALAGLGLMGADRPGEFVVEVEAGPQDRRDTPIVVPWPEGRERPRSVRVTSLDSRETVPAQFVGDEGPGVAWILRDLPKGTSRRYRISPDKEGPGGPAVHAEGDEKAVVLKVGDRPVCRYHSGLLEPPTGIDPLYGRSGFIHPLYTPSGRVVSDDFPPDHAHQHGLFFAWVNTTFDGRRIDFWNQVERTGRVRHVAVQGTEGGPVFGQFSAKLRHEALAGSEEPVPVLDEVWTVRAYNLSGRFLVDFESRPVCTGPKPLEVNAYH